MSIWKFTSLSILFPVITGAVFFRRLSISHRYLYFFVLTGFITETIAFYLKYFTGIKNNMPVGHTYISLSFVFIAMFYLHELQGYVNKKVIAGTTIVFVLFSILNVLFFQSYFDYPSLTAAISALILVVLSILLFSKVMTEGKIKHLSQSSLIWINTAVLIYYAGSFFYNILFNLMLSYSTVFLIKALSFFKILYVTFYFLLTIGFWKAGTKLQE